ncbi:MAG: hypothetical protein CL678_15795 [Bdellovibrionaceae bacterium]|nr:hypothetical protein [Pseudobdellovibrionaceae bacterium]
MNQIIYVGLDELLDTRLGTIQTLCPEAIERVMDSGWTLRGIDDVESLSGGFVTNSDFTDRYAKRDVDVLKNSRPTLIARMIHSFVMELVSKKLTDPTIDDIEVDVNVWPYILNRSEQVAMVEAVCTVLDVPCDVNLVYTSPKDLTPAKIYGRYACLYIYGINDWLMMHDEALLRRTLAAVSFISPALYLKRPEEKDNIQVEGRSVSPLEVLEESLGGVMHLELVDVGCFSVMMP